MTRLGALIQQHRDSELYPPSIRQIADRIGIAPTQLGRWTGKGEPLRRLPERDYLQAASRVLGVPYRVVLMAALVDTGYLEGRDGDADAAPNYRAGDAGTDTRVADVREEGVGLTAPKPAQSERPRRKRRPAGDPGSA